MATLGKWAAALVSVIAVHGAMALTADYWEPDNDPSKASTITVGNAGAQIGHTIHIPGDVDFIRFTAQPGRYYRIETFDLQDDPDNLNPDYHGIDTMLTLFDSDSTTALDEDNDSGDGRGSLVELYNPTQRTLYIRVIHNDGNPAIGTGTYSLRVLDLGSSGAVGTRAQRWNAGAGSFSPPAIGPDGTIYAGGSDGVYAFRPNGQTNKLAVTNAAYAVPVVADDGRVIIASVGGTVYESRADLSVIRTWTCEGNIWGGAALGRNGTIYVGTSAGLVYALAADGTIARTWNIGAQIQGTPVIGSDGTVYVGALNGRLCALAADGTITRIWNTGGPIYGSPAIGLNGTIYAASQSSNVFAFLPDGRTNFVWRTLASVHASPAIRSDNAIIVGDIAGNVYAFAADASAMGIWRLEAGVISTPAMAADGMTLVAALNGRVYGLAPNGYTNFVAAAGPGVFLSSPVIDRSGRFTISATDGKVSTFYGTAPLANSAWPMFQHDARHSGHISPLIPENVTASRGTLPGRVLVRWSQAAGAQTYSVWRSRSENTASAIRVGETSELFYNDASAQKGVSYAYWARSSKNQGLSEFSSPPAWGWIGGYALNDFDGNGASDLAVQASDYGAWYVENLAASSIVWNVAWGAAGMTAAPGDYDGDGKADLAVYQESTGLWYIQTVAGKTLLWATPFGGPGLKPVAGDYDGDGISDLAIYHKQAGLWFIGAMDGRSLLWNGAWGGASFGAVPGDYDGDFAHDLAVYSDAAAAWYIWSLRRGMIAWDMRWGGQGLIPVSGDYDGDGASDLAVYSRATGYWYILSTQGKLLAYAHAWGGPGLFPVPGDYNGDGISDLAVYDENNGLWHIASLDGSVLAFNQAWGGPGFFPVMTRW